MWKKSLPLAAVLALAVIAPAGAADKAYDEGHVWGMTMIRVKPGQLDAYMRDVLPMRKKIDEEAKKEGLLISSHVLSGEYANDGDFDVVILDEYKNFAALDGISAKYEAIMGKIGQSEEASEKAMEKRVEVRTIVGNKLFQELLPK